MIDRPIIFTAESVRAILTGRKTQTRRLVTTRHPLTFLGPSCSKDDPSEWGYAFDGPDHNGYMVLGRGHAEREDHGRISIPCPYSIAGDRLWVKETYSVDALTVYPCPSAWYRADYTEHDEPSSCEHDRWCRGPTDGQRYADCFACTMDGARFRWRSPLYMPRKLSRLTLEVAEVRVQRLQDISEDDARAEGVKPYTPPHGHIAIDQRVPGPGFDGCRLGDQPHRLPFADAWDRINGKRRRREPTPLGERGHGGTRTIVDESAAWAANPWVWAINFRRVL